MVLLSEAPSNNVDEIYEQILAMASACLRRYGAEGCRMFMLVEGNYGDYWQRTAQFFGRLPQFAPITVPYANGNEIAKFTMHNANKATLCGYVRSAMLERRVVIDTDAYFWRGGLLTACDLHTAMQQQVRNFYAYRIPTPGDDDKYRLRLTGKKRGSKDDMVICLALLMELFAFHTKTDSKKRVY